MKGTRVDGGPLMPVPEHAPITINSQAGSIDGGSEPGSFDDRMGDLTLSNTVDGQGKGGAVVDKTELRERARRVDPRMIYVDGKGNVSLAAGPNGQLLTVGNLHNQSTQAGANAAAL